MWMIASRLRQINIDNAQIQARRILRKSSPITQSRSPHRARYALVVRERVRLEPITRLVDTGGATAFTPRPRPIVMPTSFPPPPPHRGAPAPDDVPARRSWRNVARWKRWLVYWVAICIALGGVGAAIAEPSGTDDDPGTGTGTTEPAATTIARVDRRRAGDDERADAHDVGTRTDHGRARDGSRRRAADHGTDRCPRPNRRRPNPRPPQRRKPCPGRRSPSTCWR